MAADFFEMRTYQISTKFLADAVVSPAFASALNYRFVNTIPGQLGYTYRFLHGVTALSWGEEIDITLCPVGDNSTQIKVRSTCSVPMQLIDWGKNKSNVRDIWNYIEQNVAPRYNRPRINQEANAGFCGHCGAALQPGDSFCRNCGNSQS